MGAAGGGRGAGGLVWQEAGGLARARARPGRMTYEGHDGVDPGKSCQLYHEHPGVLDFC